MLAEEAMVCLDLGAVPLELSASLDGGEE